MKFSEALSEYLEAREELKREHSVFTMEHSAIVLLQKENQLDEIIDALGQAVLTHDENIKDIQKIIDRSVL